MVVFIGAGRALGLRCCFAFFGLFFLSLATVSKYALAFHMGHQDALGASAVATALLITACIAPVFQLARFNFGYLVGFYLFTMVAGYFWLNRFSELDYDHGAALITSVPSIANKFASLFSGIVRPRGANPKLPELGPLSPGAPSKRAPCFPRHTSTRNFCPSCQSTALHPQFPHQRLGDSRCLSGAETCSSA